MRTASMLSSVALTIASDVAQTGSDDVGLLQNKALVDGSRSIGTDESAQIYWCELGADSCTDQTYADECDTTLKHIDDYPDGANGGCGWKVAGKNSFCKVKDGHATWKEEDCMYCELGEASCAQAYADECDAEKRTEIDFPDNGNGGCGYHQEGLDCWCQIRANGKSSWKCKTCEAPPTTTTVEVSPEFRYCQTGKASCESAYADECDEEKRTETDPNAGCGLHGEGVDCRCEIDGNGASSWQCYAC